MVHMAVRAASIVFLEFGGAVLNYKFIFCRMAIGAELAWHRCVRE